MIRNQAFIDAQNLFYTISQDGWTVDLNRFFVYLREKYHVEKAYYFMGAYDARRKGLYHAIQRAGFILVFRRHNLEMFGNKKGNVDTDIVFAVMKKLVRGERFDKVVLVSGDGDYVRMVEFLVAEGRFEALLAPSRRTLSSLYSGKLAGFCRVLDSPSCRSKIEHKK